MRPQPLPAGVVVGKPRTKPAGRQTPERRPSALLISMPWTALGEPSLGLSVLRSLCDEAGIPCRVWHLNIFLLCHLQATTYLALANSFALNDWLFSGGIDPETTPAQRRLLRERVEDMLTLGLVDPDRFGGIDGLIDKLVHLRDEVIPKWLDEACSTIVNSGATLVGFTCMFDQTVASLALAQKLKQRSPSIMIALGGYALRTPTGEQVMRSFPFVDAICIGEGEPVIVPLAKASVGAIRLEDVPNLLIRSRSTQAGTIETLPAPTDLDSSPTPNFDDFFADLRALKEHHAVEIVTDTLPYETSRGCWWGQTKHCVFCGIRDSDLVYRARKAETVLAALERLAGRYKCTSFRFSDYILPHQYHRTLIPALIEAGAPFRLACEMKANTSPELMQGLAAAGFCEVQPGIESFSTQVLKAMDKGVTALKNIETLVLGKTTGIHIHYNILYGFPDDDRAAYEAMLELVPKLFHLDPPLTRTEVQITRYAPLQVDPGRFGIERARHEKAYELIFSRAYRDRTRFDLDNYCYYFERPFENRPTLTKLYRKLEQLIHEWKAFHEQGKPALTYDVRGEQIEFFDARRAGHESRFSGEAREALVYSRLARGIITRLHLREALEGTMSTPEVESSLAWLDQRGLILSEGESLLGLATPVKNPVAVAEAETERLWAVA